MIAESGLLLGDLWNLASKQMHPSFIHDLNALADQQSRDLSLVFNRLRVECTERVRSRLNELPADHPLFSPVTAFGMVDYGRLETAYTRALAWLFTPQESHGYGDSIVREVFSNLLPTASVDNVSAEHRILLRDGSFGRIDIWIEAGTAIPTRQSHLIAIEAKIDAPLSTDQLRRYAEVISATNFAKKDCLYLTGEGHTVRLPRPWKPVSFKSLAGAIWRAGYKNKAAPGYQFVRMFVAGILKDVLKGPLPVDSQTSRPVWLYSYLNQEGYDPVLL
jgi:PD-(D/E)XK nuclease superfamily protein